MVNIGKWLRTLMPLLVLVALAPTASFADILWDNGGPNQANGNEMSQWIQTENFTLSADSTITSIRFWDGNAAGAYQGSITWIIYGDAGGLPGAIIAMGTAMPTRTATGLLVAGFLPEFINDFNLNVSLTAGNYHLGLHNGPLSHTSRDEFYWETTSAVHLPTGIECDLSVHPSGCTGAQWFNNGQEHAFLINGTGGTVVPEPTSLILLGTGLMGIAGRKLKKLRGV